MAGITTAPTVRCITISPAAAELVVAKASGSQPNSEAATVTPMTWPIAIVWTWPARFVVMT